MEADVNSSLCTGCGTCEEMCPEVFELQDDMAVVIMDDVPEDAEGACREAAAACPVEAISIDE